MKTYSILVLILFTQLATGCKEKPMTYLLCGQELEFKNDLQRKYQLHFACDYAEGLECAAKMQKPVLVVFTGYACVGYDVFSMDLLNDKEVRQHLEDDFMTILLYVDDKNPLTESEEIIRKRYLQQGVLLDNERRLKTVGHLNSAIQTSIFKENAQVFFGLITPSGENLAEPFVYNRKEAEFFISKLDSALMAWEKRIKD